MKYSKQTSDAHTPDGRRLWDVERWDVVKPWAAPRPAGVPTGATQDYGYVDSEGQQHCVYQRVVRKPEAAESN